MGTDDELLELLHDVRLGVDKQNKARDSGKMTIEDLTEYEGSRLYYQKPKNQPGNWKTLADMEQQAEQERINDQRKARGETLETVAQEEGPPRKRQKSDSNMTIVNGTVVNSKPTKS